MPPRKTQTIKEVMKESQSIIEQKLGATRSKKVKKNESEEDSEFVTTSSKSKQKNSNASSKIKSSTNKQKESLNQSKEEPQDKLSPELKPSSQRQKARTKAEKIQDKHNAKTDEIKVKQQNVDENKILDKQDNHDDHDKKKETNQQRSQIDEENKEIDLSQKSRVNVNEKNKSDNQENLDNKPQESLNENNSKEPNIEQLNKDANEQEIKNSEDNAQLLNKQNNQEDKQINNIEKQSLRDNIDQCDKRDNNQQQEDKNNGDEKDSDQNLIPKIIITAPNKEVANNHEQQKENQRDEEEKEQLEKQQQQQSQSFQKKEINEKTVIVDIVFCFDINLLDSHNVEQLKNVIEFIVSQLKEREKFTSNIKFSIVHFNDITSSQKLQQCQVIDLCEENEILQSLEEIKGFSQVEMKKGLCNGLKLAAFSTKWRIQNNTKCFRYIIHLANKQLELDNQSDELEHIIQEMNNKTIRYKYIRIDKKIDLDFDGKQYFQNKLNSYEESFLKEFGYLKNVLSSIIIREIQHENIK